MGRLGDLAHFHMWHSICSIGDGAEKLGREGNTGQGGKKSTIGFVGDAAGRFFGSRRQAPLVRPRVFCFFCFVGRSPMGSVAEVAARQAWRAASYPDVIGSARLC